jgi:hypothetical protein
VQGKTHRDRIAAICAAALVASALAAATAPAVSAGPRLPPQGKTFFGLTDSGEMSHFKRFARLVREHPAVLATFDNWGPGKVKAAFERWIKARARPMLTIQTGPGYETPTPIPPRDIAKGAGDEYLLFLNRRFAAFNRPAYIRPLPEPNGHWNPYSPYNSDGSLRGPENKQGWYRLAWRRMVIIVRDGGKLKNVNARLAKDGLPPVRFRPGVKPPPRLSRTKTAFVWVPQTFGSPNVPRNMPRHFWPGRRFVDWIGADFYSKFQTWSSLNRFYRGFKRKPFAFGEWGVWGADDPGFVRRIFKWQRTHERVRMMVYYNGGSLSGTSDNPFDIAGRPRSRVVLRKQLDFPGYPAFAREWAR